MITKKWGLGKVPLVSFVINHFQFFMMNLRARTKTVIMTRGRYGSVPQFPSPRSRKEGSMPRPKMNARGSGIRSKLHCLETSKKASKKASEKF